MKKIYEMSIDEMIEELRAFCITHTECKRCELSLINHLGDINVGHKPFINTTDRHFLILMVAIARGYLVWKRDEKDPNDPALEDLIKSGSNVPEQPTVPPMPEPVEPVEPVKTVESVESIEAKVSELSVNMPEDMTVIVISGKKPTSMTVFYDQEGGGTDGA